MIDHIGFGALKPAMPPRPVSAPTANRTSPLPDELPGKLPDEFPVRGPNGLQSPNPATDK